LPNRATFHFSLVLALRKLNPVGGVTGFFDNAGRIKSMGIHCALCHSPLDDSFAPGIGRRLDGWPNRDLNAGAIINLAPDVSPFTATLQVDEATVHTVLNRWGLAQNLCRATASGWPETLHSISLIIPAGSPGLDS
jgi:hypothetical protein